MALRPVHHDAFESLLREASEAERAGVFSSTSVDIADVMARPAAPRPIRLYRFVLAGLPVAAALALFLGTAAFWKVGQPGRTTLTNGDPDAAERCQTLENLRACFTGPGVLARMDCRCVDLDADGDVDLRDLGLFQLAEEGHTSR